MLLFTALGHDQSLPGHKKLFAEENKWPYVRSLGLNCPGKKATQPLGYNNVHIVNKRAFGSRNVLTIPYR